MAKRTCDVDGCEKPHRARGLCITHYQHAHQPNRHAQPTVCDACGETFGAQRSRQRFCSILCREYARNGLQPVAHPLKCWCRVTREQGRTSRARRRAGESEPYDRATIYARDRWRCHICRERVDPETQWPDPMCPSIDHVIPTSQGGPDSAANVRLAHLACNVTRSNRGGGEQLALVG